MGTSGDERVRLGGMALRNGILVQGPEHWAAAVRTDDGEIRVASGRKPELPAGPLGVPGLRGVLRVAEAMYLLPIMRRALPEARLPMEGAGTAGAMAASVVIARALRMTKLSPVVAEAAGAGLALLPALASLRGSQLARYHGAEHKTIGGYEQGGEALDASKEHERCGSHLVAPMLAVTVAGNALVSRLSPRRRGPARLAVTLGAVGLATETFAWMQHHRGSGLERALSRPGFALQRVAATREPTDEELEVAGRALDEVLRLEGVVSAK